MFRRMQPIEQTHPPITVSVGLVRKREHQHGRWPLNVFHPDRIPDMEAGPGKASRWTTPRALRVLDWHWN